MDKRTSIVFLFLFLSVIIKAQTKGLPNNKALNTRSDTVDVLDYEINLDLHGNPNVLTKDVGTSELAQGPTSHTCLVEIRKAKQSEIKKVKIFIKPNMQKKA